MAGIDLSTTFGVIYWGFVIATVLFGISVVQGYFFFLGNKDSWKLKAFVALLLLLDLSTTALSSECLHYYLIVNFGNPLALLFMTKAYVSEYVLTLIVIFLSQNFYAWRIYAVNRQVWIPLLIFFLASCAFGAGVALTFELFTVDLLVTSLSISKICVSLATSLAAACDLVSTAAMCCFLASHRSAYKGTNTPLKTLLFFTVNRGILVAIAQIGYLAMFVAYPSRAYWIPFHLSISKLHVNTLLAMLNSRATLRARADATKLEITTNFASTCQNSPNSPSPRTPCKRQNSGLATFGLVDLPRDRKRSSMIFASVQKQPRSIEEELGGCDMDVSSYGKPISMLYTGGVEPITFA